MPYAPGEPHYLYLCRINGFWIAIYKLGINGASSISSFCLAVEYEEDTVTITLFLTSLFSFFSLKVLITLKCINE